MVNHKYTNALVNETSPYLLQHAHNPVEWYPWGEEALSRAREEDKPILLSIGYSACHWCHVMERESFENEDIAKLMNAHFINIKVDREERPDLDSIYMAVVQMVTGSGGWPMTVFLTPEQEPFFCGTYFPPVGGLGKPSFPQVIQSVVQAYREKKQALNDSASSIVGELQKLNRLPDSQDELDPQILAEASSGIISNYDARNGGFGSAPKFPPSMALSFLMRAYSRSREERLLEIVENTLMHMACGGMYDQVGGGFHRYSVDAQWLVPHFEKMLYDNALLSRVYLDACLLTGKVFYRRIAEDTLDYVLREMASPEGGFYSSQDADSEGREGAFFLWSRKEIQSLLGDGDAEIFCRYFDVTPEGNFEGENILNVPRPPHTFADLERIPGERLEAIIRSGKNRLFNAREHRIKPGRDDKILTAWNGLMLRSFAEAANAMGREDYREAAVRNAEFLLSRLRKNGRLFRSYKDGRARFNAYLEDYAYLLDGLLSLYEASFDPRWITEAESLAERMVDNFWDRSGDGFYFTSEDHESLIHRPKEFYDHAVPSGNSVSAHALLKLWKFTGDDRWSSYSVSIFKRMIVPMRRHPGSFAHLLCALDFYLGQPREIAVAGSSGSPDTKALLDEVFGVYMPNKVVACGSNAETFLLKDKPQVNGQATAYVCENFTCKAPVTTAEELRQTLQSDLT
ncbi:MAG: thioredoxin domain-containing protein [Acidobacteria bacterium]|nr:thioredoxin domain-containing protein [Acidobacteriota bacterium]